MRKEHGQRFWWVSLFTVFLLQGVILWLISLTVQVGQVSPSPHRMALFDRNGRHRFGLLPGAFHGRPEYIPV